MTPEPAAAQHPTPHPTPNTTYTPPTRVYLTSAGLMLLFCGVFGYIAANGKGVFVYIAAAMAVLGAAFLLRMVFRAVLRKPLVVLDARGLTFGYKEFVAWDAIASVSIRHRIPGDSVNKYNAINFEVRDLDEYLAGTSWTYRRNAKIWRRQGDGPLRLAASGFSVPMVEVVSAMRRYHPALVVRP